jgi:hypothetical protein
MARIEHIKHRLERWGKWCTERESGGQGYPSQSSFLRIGGVIGGLCGAITGIDIECGETHDAVLSLRHTRPELYRCLDLVYKESKAYKVAAGLMHKNESSVRSYLDQADKAVDSWLREKHDKIKAVQTFALEK